MTLHFLCMLNHTCHLFYRDFLKSSLPPLGYLRIFFFTLLEQLFGTSFLWLRIYHGTESHLWELFCLSNDCYIKWVPNKYLSNNGQIFLPIAYLFNSIILFLKLKKNHMLEDIIQGSFTEILTFSQRELTSWGMLVDNVLPLVLLEFLSLNVLIILQLPTL